jgi:hypothetical protein
MPSKIILSYRRSDSDVITGRIRDKLASYYGDDAVFMDIDSISLGFDYRKQIKDALLQNKIFIAVIGPKWLGTKGTETRINDENDPVRIEVETALQQGIPVIPVLVSGATMPNATELPSSLQNLCYLNAAEVDGGRDFHQHMGRLIRGIDQILKTSEPLAAEKVSSTQQASSTGQTPKQSRKWIPVALGAIACLMLISIGIWAYPSISSYIKSKTLTQVVVNPTPNPAPPPPPAPNPAPPPPAIAPPPFSSAACKPESASFYDDFHKPDPGWNLIVSDSQHYDEGQLVLKPKPNEGASLKYLSLRYENVTICAHIKSPPQLKALDGDANGGVLFWTIDNDNYYYANVWSDGSYAIWRKFAGNFISLVPRTKNEQINSGTNAVNEVRVVLVDNFGALFINNVKVQEFRGQPPKGGAALGLRGESEPTVSDEWRFLDIAVMDNGKSKPVVLSPAPSGPTIADCRPANSTDFQDTFAKPNPEWILDNAVAHYVDGQLLLKPKEDETFPLLYRTLVFKNATVCLTLKSPLEVTDLEEASSGGLLFWANNNQNFYKAAIFPNGTFHVTRLFNNSWVTVVPRTMSDTIKKGIGAVNELQVVLSNNNGLLYINGIQVQAFRGQPPKDGGAIGVYAQSESQQRSEWRFFNITVVENQ